MTLFYQLCLIVGWISAGVFSFAPHRYPPPSLVGGCHYHRSFLQRKYPITPSLVGGGGKHPCFLLAIQNDGDDGGSDTAQLLERPSTQQDETLQRRKREHRQQHDDESTTTRSTLLSSDASGVPQIQDMQDDESSSILPADEGDSSPKSDADMARLLLIGAAALYGTNFSIVKMLGQTDMSIALSATLRFGLAALATSPWLFGKSNGPPAEAEGSTDHRLDATLRGMEVGGWNAIGYIAQAIGLETTLASKSAFLCSLAVVTVPLLDLATGRRMKTRQIIGIVLALLGVAVLELGGLSASDLALSSGDLASMIQPLAFGVAFWRMEKTMHRYPQEAKRATAAQLLAVFLVSAAYGAITSPEAFSMAQILQDISQPTILLSLFWTGCITTALTIYMESNALRSLSAAETTLILSTEPLWGTSFAAVVLGEQLGVDTAIGAVLVIAACLVSNLGLEGIKHLLMGTTTDGDLSSDEEKKGEKIGGVTRTGFFAATGSSFLGAFKETFRVIAEQIQDFVGGVLPPGPPEL